MRCCFKTLFLGTLFLFAVLCSFAQTDSTLVSFDRPGISDSPYIIGLRTWQIEGGLDYTKGSDIGGSLYPSILIRKAISKNWELRLTNDHQPYSQFIAQHYDEDEDAGYPLSLMAKWKFLEEDGIIPDAALMGGFILPIKKGLTINELDTEIGYEVYLLLQNNPTDRFSINYDIGYLLDHPRIGHLFTYAICFNYALTPRLGIFMENYGYFRNFRNQIEEGIDTGLVVMTSNKTQIDISGGFSILQGKTWHFLALGYSINF